MLDRLLTCRRFLLICWLPFLAIAAEQQHTIVVDGKQRCFQVYVPNSLPPDTSAAVVLVFHGGGGSPEAAKQQGGWIQQAERSQFLFVFPAGTAADPERRSSFVHNQRTWNDGSQRPSVGAAERGEADVAFVRSMLHLIDRRYRVDSRRIYATGFSNGASMCLRLGREMSRRFAAIAPVAGADFHASTIPAPPRAVPLCYVTGDQDPLNPLAGGEIAIGEKSFGSKPPVMSIIRDWRSRHDCRRIGRSERNDHRALLTHWYAADDHPAVSLLIVKGHGHHWPGGPQRLPEWLAGPYDPHALSATSQIWRFFSGHRLPEGLAPPEPNG